MLRLMYKSKNNQTGFGITTFLIAIVIVSLIGIVGWWVYKSNNTHSNTNLVTDYKSCTLNALGGYDVLYGCNTATSTKAYKISGIKNDSGLSDPEGAAIISAMDVYCKSYSSGSSAINNGTDLFFREGDFAKISSGCKYSVENAKAFGQNSVGFEVLLKKVNGIWQVIDANQQAPSCSSLDGKGFPAYFTTCQTGSGSVPPYRAVKP